MEATMPTAERGLEAAEAVREDARVTAWRFDQLRQAGYDEAAAADLAERDDIDLHRAVELVEAGCPPALALRILG